VKRQCPKCAYHWAWKLKDGRYKCRKCGHRYIFKSIWNTFRISESNKKQLLEYFVLGVPVYRLRFRSKVSDETIKKFFRVIRKLLCIAEDCTEPFTGEIECDETTFGGRRAGKRGWGAAGKIIVFGILKRDGEIRVFPIAERKNEIIQKLIEHHTKPGSLYYTDDWHAYASLSLRGNHVVVSKEKGKPKGRDHINSIEGFWSYAKHWLYQYRGIPKKFFHFYLGEISFRFNHRDKDIFPTILKMLKDTPFDKNLVRIV